MASAPEQGWTTQLLHGLGQHLAASGAAVWQPTGSYPEGTRRGVYLAGVPSAPDEVVVLSAYDVDPRQIGTGTVQGVQVRTRGAAGSSTSVLNLDDAVRNALDGLAQVWLNGVFVALVERVSGSGLGIDAGRRHERTANYYVTATRPGTYRTDD